MNMTQKTQPDQKQECGICTELIFSVLCPSIHIIEDIE